MVIVIYELYVRVIVIYELPMRVNVIYKLPVILNVIYDLFGVLFTKKREKIGGAGPLQCVMTIAHDKAHVLCRV